jgi:hypothetical protein
MRTRLLLVSAFVLPLLLANTAHAQRRDDRAVYLTVFRNPSSGVEFRAARIGVHAGFYPTILKADGEAKGKNTNFLRFGATMYSSATGTAVYVSPSFVLSLDKRFRSGFLTDAGVRGRITDRVSGRLGAGLLNTLNGEVRVNPTVGLDVRLGAAR